MSLINCPDCYKPVSNQAITCLNCGRPIKQDLSESFGTRVKKSWRKIQIYWYDTLPVIDRAVMVLCAWVLIAFITFYLKLFLKTPGDMSVNNLSTGFSFATAFLLFLYFFLYDTSKNSKWHNLSVLAISLSLTKIFFALSNMPSVFFKTFASNNFPLLLGTALIIQILKFFSKSFKWSETSQVSFRWLETSQVSFSTDLCPHRQTRYLSVLILIIGLLGQSLLPHASANSTPASASLVPINEAKIHLKAKFNNNVYKDLFVKEAKCEFETAADAESYDILMKQKKYLAASEKAIPGSKSANTAKRLNELKNYKSEKNSRKGPPSLAVNAEQR